MLPFRFYLITDRPRTRHAPGKWLPLLVDGGLRALQIREPETTPADVATFAQALLHDLGDRRDRVRLYLNDRADLALSLGLDGCHLRTSSLPLGRQHPLLRDRLDFGVSTHSPAEVQAAEQAGASFVVFGPVYATASKAGYGAPLGLRALEDVAARTQVPILALGGITPQRAGECLAAGAHGVAAIGAIWNAERPDEALQAFAAALGGL